MRDFLVAFLVMITAHIVLIGVALQMYANGN
jgi:hypothetical protein